MHSHFAFTRSEVERHWALNLYPPLCPCPCYIPGSRIPTPTHIYIYPLPAPPHEPSNERKHNFPMFCTNSLFDRKILFLHSNRSAKQKMQKSKETKKNSGKKSKMALQFCLGLTLPFGLLFFAAYEKWPRSFVPRRNPNRCG